MKGFAYEYVHKLSQFITTLSPGENCSIDLIQISKSFKYFNFLSILSSKPLREYRQTNFQIGDRVRISKHDLTFRKGYKLQYTQEVLETVGFFFRKPPTYKTKDEQGEIIRGNFYQEELIKVI